ncbi:MAG: succinate dehydrogenase, cytochrome b556 subunit [Gammaproteobacteria bacterium]|nr:succinate dehydrogenase, cytochrome b556 subunit [Gammaproteobacteria bacterium]
MAVNRPLSPHLQVYRWQLTSVLSILHRASGVFLSAGALLLAYWLVSLASGPECFAATRSILGSLPGQIALFAWTAALFYHLCNGVRHLCWDAGLGFDLPAVYRSGYAVVAASIVLTVLAWVLALAGGGA